MLEWLIEDPHNPAQLITAPCTSPEADYITDKGYRGSSLYGGTADLAIYGGAAGMMAGEIVERELAAERWRNRAWTVHVQLDSGPTQTFAYTAPPPWRRGERVRIIGGRLAPMPGARAGAGR
jgi:hypothetical protein